MPRQRGASDRIIARRADVARLYCRGWPQHQIASKYSVTQQQIAKDLGAIRSEWRRTMVEQFDAYKAEQLRKIDEVEIEAWRGWRRSLRDAHRRTDKETPTGSETATVTEGQAGDPRFLQIIDTCVDRRLRIIGGYAEKGTGEQPPAEIVVRVLGPGLSMAELHGGTTLNARNALPAH